ncbi:Small GTPase like protein [Aduncisulcus paluster]|uniref:Small GTPase like protein n=1 Tax=Aduncisulcus paluster TaxID=2918883 RepID=A0ABQ5K4L0_9EUKA|nr:Small GTPase like protein [Aduncisulcus paluster]
MDEILESRSMKHPYPFDRVDKLSLKMHKFDIGSKLCHFCRNGSFFAAIHGLSNSMMLNCEYSSPSLEISRESLLKVREDDQKFFGIDIKFRKTAVALRALHGRFIVSSLTIGVDFVTHEVSLSSDLSICERIFDTSGQEKYGAITESFFRGSDACVIFASCDDKKSVDLIPSWKKRVEDANDDDVDFVICFNKMDLLVSDSPTNPEAARKVAASVGIDSVYITSAKTGEGISEMLRAVACRVGGVRDMEVLPDRIDISKPYDEKTPSKGGCCSK